MTITGRIGTTAVVNKEQLPANINQHIVRMRVKDCVKPLFVASYLNSDIGLTLSNRGVTGTTRVALDYESIKAIPFPIMSNKKQNALISLWTNAVTAHTAKLCEADNLLAGMDEYVLRALGIELSTAAPTLSYAVKRVEIEGSEMFCRPTYPSFLQLMHSLKNSKWYRGDLINYIDVNPRTDTSSLRDENEIAFIPMTNVSNKDNSVIYDIRAYGEVKKGFTVFQKGDLLWAKITPCMQNGKSCLTDEMPTTIGFGSTEFHVLRKKEGKDIYMPYLWSLLSNHHVLEAAQAVFNGSAGQQRVSPSFLEKLPVPLPDMSVQIEIADRVQTMLTTARQLKQEAEQDFAAAKAQFEKELLGE